MVTSYLRFFWAVILVSVFLSATLSAQAANPAKPRYPISKNELRVSLDEIDGLIREGAFLEAKARYQTLLQYDLSDEDRCTFRTALEDLNLKILFSPILEPDSFHHVVEKGDSLYEIAKKYNTTVELIKKS